MTFQLNAKNVFLTYPRCTLPKEDLLQHLLSLFPESTIRVGHELHRDEGDHLHAFIANKQPIRLKGDTAKSHFDFRGHHPNIQSARKPKECLNYCGKDGDYIDSAAFDLEPTKRCWSDVIKAESASEALALSLELFPRDYVLNHEKLEYFINKHFKVEIPAYIPDPEQLFNITNYPDLTTWLNQREKVRGAVPGGGGTSGRTRPSGSDRSRDPPAFLYNMNGY